jgi:ketosteroid isomerase-like protein
MFAQLVKARIRRIFAALDRGEYEETLAGMADRFEHRFAGNHPLGGTRHSRVGMRHWFERLFRLNQKLCFDIKHIAVAGWPWDTIATVEWTDAATLADGCKYLNTGVHVIRLKWGKVVSIHAYLDTRKLEEACGRMALSGIREAEALPIED